MTLVNSYVPPAASDAAPVTFMNFTALLDSLSDKDRVSLERHHQAHESKLGPAPAERWRGIACVLRTLAPGPVKLAGSSAMQFFIPDGKYRKQVFALQVLAGGVFTIYAPDVLAEAMEAGLLSGHEPAENDNTYHLAQSDEVMAIDALDAKTPGPDAFYKDLTGWNRRAMRMTLPPGSTGMQFKAVSQLCALAASQWTLPANGGTTPRCPWDGDAA